MCFNVTKITLKSRKRTQNVYIFTPKRGYFSCIRFLATIFRLHPRPTHTLSSLSIPTSYMPDSLTPPKSSSTAMPCAFALATLTRSMTG